MNCPPSSIWRVARTPSMLATFTEVALAAWRPLTTGWTAKSTSVCNVGDVGILAELAGDEAGQLVELARVGLHHGDVAVGAGLLVRREGALLGPQDGGRGVGDLDVADVRRGIGISDDRV